MIEDISQQKQEKALQEKREQTRQEARPREVLGSMVLDFHITDGALLPTSDMDLTLLFQSQAGDRSIRHKIRTQQRDWSEWRSKSPENARAMATLNFNTPLPPGDYLLQSIEVEATAMSESSFQLPMDARFNVPVDTDCVYIGRSFLVYFRLPPGTRTMQKMDAAALGRRLGTTHDYIYLKKGGLLLARREVDSIPSENESRSLIKKSRKPYLQAREKGCRMLPVEF